MGRFVSNLKLLHKLAIPGVTIVIAALATVALAKSWMDVFETNVTTIVDQHATRLERALTIVGNLNEATLTQRDLRLARKVEDAEKLAVEYRGKLMAVARQVDAIIPLMIDPEQRKLAEEAKAAFVQFLGVGGEQRAQIIEALKTNTQPPSNGRGRVWRHMVDELLGKLVALSREDMRRAKEQGMAEGRQAADRRDRVCAAGRARDAGMDRARAGRSSARRHHGADEPARGGRSHRRGRRRRAARRGRRARPRARGVQ